MRATLLSRKTPAVCEDVAEFLGLAVRRKLEVLWLENLFELLELAPRGFFAVKPLNAKLLGMASRRASRDQYSHSNATSISTLHLLARILAVRRACSTCVRADE